MVRPQSPDLFDAPELLLLLLERDLLGGKIHVGPEHPLAVKARLFFDLGPVQGNRPPVYGETLPEALVADERLGFGLELLLERFDYGVPVGRILFGLPLVETNDNIKLTASP